MTPLISPQHLGPRLPVCEHFAGSERFALKAISLQSSLVSKEGQSLFDVTLDLEDGAPAGQEAELRTLFVDLARSTRNHPGRIGLRVHDPRHEAFTGDLEAALRHASNFAYLTIPKVQDGGEAVQLAKRIAKSAPLGATVLPKLHFLIETHGALADVHKIAALPSVEVLDFGIMDFISEHNGAIPASAMATPGQFTHPLIVRAKTEISAAAHAFGKVPSHSVTIDVTNPATAESDARRAFEEFGFLRMWSVHPDQIPAIIRGFAPRDEEVALAEKVLQTGQAAAWGPTRIDGKLYDRASYRYYYQVLERRNLTRAGSA